MVGKSTWSCERRWPPQHRRETAIVPLLGLQEDTSNAAHKTLILNRITIFRVDIFTTLKMVKQLSHSDLQVTQNVSS